MITKTVKSLVTTTFHNACGNYPMVTDEWIDIDFLTFTEYMSGVGTLYEEVDKNALLGQQEVWEDLPIPTSSMPVVGINTPEYKYFKTRTVTSGDTAIYFNDTDAQFGTIQNYAAIDNLESYTLACWIKPDNDEVFQIAYKGVNGAEWDWYVEDGKMLFGNGHDYTSQANKALVSGVWHFVIASVQTVNSTTRVRLYQDGKRALSATLSSAAATGTGDITVCKYSSAGYAYGGAIDEFQIYDDDCSYNQAKELWNNGIPTTAIPSSMLEELVARFQFEDGSGTSATNSCNASYPMALSERVTWVAGVMNTENVQVYGIAAPAFRPDMIEELQYSDQILHAYDLSKGADGFGLHFHWSKSTDSNDTDETHTVCWVIQLTHAPINEAFCEIMELRAYVTLPNHLGSTDTARGDHLVTDFPLTEEFIAMLDNLTSVSSIMSGRIFRDVTDEHDNFIGDAFLHSFDAHIIKKAGGSISQWH